jgi:hypothetical protein
VDLINEEHISLAKRGENRCEISWALYRRTRGALEPDTYFCGYNSGQRCFAKPGRAVQQYVVEGFAPTLAGVARDLEVASNVFLPNVFVEPAGSQRRD